jgi:hypothetical protein
MQTDSLETEQRGIFSSDVGLYAKRKLFRGFKLNLEIHHRAYSDGNSFNSTRLSPEYDFRMIGADLAFGYRVEDKTFARHTNDGYSNPPASLAQQVFWDLSYYPQRYYISLDVAAGRATPNSSPTATASSNFSGEGVGTIGWRLSKAIILELTASGGDYGFNYSAKRWTEMSTGFAVNYSF